MKRVLGLTGALLAGVGALAIASSGLAQQAAAPARAAAAAPANPPFTPAPGKIEVFTPMRDGVKLASTVYLPQGQGNGPWPVILTRTPYIKDSARYASVEAAKRYTDKGYVYVVQDSRGKGHSEGFYEAFANDIDDGYDTVEWLAVQSWSNGKIGITGGSAMGIAANAAAAANPPHLVAAYVVVAPVDRLQTTAINGVFKDADTAGWLRRQGVAEDVIENARARVLNDARWDRVDFGPYRKYVDIPIYNVGGWYDIFSIGGVENFRYLQNEGAEGARGNQKLRMGPFGHGALSGDLAYPGEDGLRTDGDDEIRWFDHWLKGVDNGIDREPPVAYYNMASARKGAFSAKNGFRYAANWPIAHRETRFYLTADKGLTTKAPTAAEAKTSYRFDPSNPVKTFGGANLTFDRGPMDQRAVGERRDYLRYMTPPLTEDVAIAGPVSVELFGATDGMDTDFVVKLVDVYPDGYEALVLDAPIRTRYRKGRMPGDVTPMVPNVPEKLDIDLWHTAITFEKGHRIALHVTSSNSPRFDVNPNTWDEPGKAKAKPRTATNTVFHDKARPSALVLPLVYPERSATPASTAASN